MENRGIVYIAIGQKALEMAIDAAKSVIDRSHESPSITVLCDREFSDADTGISFVNIGNYSGAYWKNGSCAAAYLKTCLHRLSPYDKTLYLDNDIRAVKSIDNLWDYVDEGIGFCNAFNPLIKDRDYPDNSEELYTANVITNWHQYNAGMFLFVKSDLTFDFFENWNHQWKKFRNHENMALTRLLDYSQIKLIQLPCKFNDFYPNKNQNSILVHYISHYKEYLNG
jgi:alpha-N-acetylglucosamine transferase